MRYLLDTHTLIWFFNEPERLSKKAFEIIEDQKTDCLISKTSLFEIVIKSNINKLNFQLSMKEIEITLSNLKIDILELETKYLDFFVKLPQTATHKDPFDRLIISTAAVEGLKIISKDEKFNLYQDIVETVW